MEFFRSIYHSLPRAVQNSLNPAVEWLIEKYTRITVLGWRGSKQKRVNIQTVAVHCDVSYKHNLVKVPQEKLFWNNYLPNDYSEIEEAAQRWNDLPYLRASIITASYNQKTTLYLHLLGWTRQKYPSELFEVIVVDDGSSDGTEEMVAEIKTKLPFRLKYYKQADDGFRLAKVRNEGTRLSEGDVLLFVDADTIPSPEYLFEHMKYYHVSDRVAVIGMRHRISPEIAADTILNDIESLRTQPMLEDQVAPENVKQWRKNVLFNNLAFRKQWQIWGGYHGTLNSCRKIDMVGVGGWPEDFRVYGQEDTEMGFRLLSKIQYLISNPSARLYHLEHPDHPNKLDPKNIELLKEKTRFPILTFCIVITDRFSNLDNYINKLLGMTFQDFEILIVNNGCRDPEVGRVLDRFRYHKQVRVYYTPHSSEGRAYNTALIYARGQFLEFLSEELQLDPKSIGAFIGKFNSDKSTGAIIGGYLGLWDDEEVLCPEYYPGALAFNPSFRAPMMFRKSILFQTGGFSENIQSDHLFDIALKVEEVSKVQVLPTVVATQTKNQNVSETRIRLINDTFWRRGANLQVGVNHLGIVYRQVDERRSYADSGVIWNNTITSPSVKLRILILQPTSISDVILTLPLMKALRIHYPESEITLVAERRFTGILSEWNIADRIIELSEFAKEKPFDIGLFLPPVEQKVIRTVRASAVRIERKISYVSSAIDQACLTADVIDYLDEVLTVISEIHPSIARLEMARRLGWWGNIPSSQLPIFKIGSEMMMHAAKEEKLGDGKVIAVVLGGKLGKIISQSSHEQLFALIDALHVKAGVTKLIFMRGRQNVDSFLPFVDSLYYLKIIDDDLPVQSVVQYFRTCHLVITDDLDTINLAIAVNTSVMTFNRIDKIERSIVQAESGKLFEVDIGDVSVIDENTSNSIVDRVGMILSGIKDSEWVITRT